MLLYHLYSLFLLLSLGVLHLFSYIRTSAQNLIDPCAVYCVFLGYGAPYNKKSYRYYDPITKRVYVTIDVLFLEFEYFYLSVSTSPLQEGRHGIKRRSGGIHRLLV